MNLWLIPTLPLIGAAINGLFGRRMPKMAINAVAVLSVVASFLLALNVFNNLGDQPIVERYFTWIASGALTIPVEFAVDRLTMVVSAAFTSHDRSRLPIPGVDHSRYNLLLACPSPCPSHSFFLPRDLKLPQLPQLGTLKRVTQTGG